MKFNKRNNKLLNAFISLVMCIMVLPLYTTHAAKSTTTLAQAENVRIYFSSANSTLPPDTTLSLMLDAKSYQVAFARIDLSFDPSKIQLSSEIQITGLLGTVVSRTSKATANSTGSITIILGIAPGDPAPTGVFEFAQISLHAVTPVQQNTNISIVAQNVEIVDVNVNDLPFVSEPAPIIVGTANLVWSDEFNGSGGINSSNWICDTGTHYTNPNGPAHWGTNEVESYSCSTNNVFQSGGNLNIRALHTGTNPLTNWTSGRIETVPTNFQPSPNGIMVVETRIQLPNVNSSNGLGYWPGFWMLGAPFRGNYWNWPSVGEIDVMENVNGLNRWWGGLHCGISPGGPCNETSGINNNASGFNPSLQAAFHTYRLEFDRSVSPQQLRWYVDNVQYHIVYSNQVDAATWNNATNHGFFILLNLAMGGAFTDAVAGVTTPTSATISGGIMLVDYVRVYQSPVAISGNVGAAGATLSYLDGTPKTVVSDGSGNYSITVPSGWIGTITPYKSGYTFTPVNRSYSNVQSNQVNQNYTAQVCVNCADINVSIGGSGAGAYTLASSGSRREVYEGLNNGPVKVANTLGNPILASQRVLYGNSYSEMMGLPLEQLSHEYWFPYYNNVAMDSQLRVSNLGGGTTTIKVYLGTQQIDSYSLGAGGATRKNYPGKNGGPLRVTSSATNILSTIRVLYGGNSYSELMGLPLEQLTNEYLFPYYNNVAMDSQLRVSNVGGAPTTIKVYLGTEQIDSYSLGVGGASRKNYPGKNGGPLRVTSSASNILSTIRVLYGGTSLSELMGFPGNQLDQEYWYPVYDNSSLDSQLRVSNVGAGTTTITVYAAGDQIDSYNLAAGAATRKNYGQNTGPLHVVSSSEPILTTIRLLYNTSLYEMTGLPHGELSTQYFFPWYNNSAMNSELRFAVP